MRPLSIYTAKGRRGTLKRGSKNSISSKARAKARAKSARATRARRVALLRSTPYANAKKIENLKREVRKNSSARVGKLNYETVVSHNFMQDDENRMFNNGPIYFCITDPHHGQAQNPICRSLHSPEGITQPQRIDHFTLPIDGRVNPVDGEGYEESLLGIECLSNEKIPRCVPNAKGIFIKWVDLQFEFRGWAQNAKIRIDIIRQKRRPYLTDVANMEKNCLPYRFNEMGHIAEFCPNHIDRKDFEVLKTKHVKWDTLPDFWSVGPNQMLSYGETTDYGMVRDNNDLGDYTLKLKDDERARIERMNEYRLQPKKHCRMRVPLNTWIKPIVPVPHDDIFHHEHPDEFEWYNGDYGRPTTLSNTGANIAMADLKGIYNMYNLTPTKRVFCMISVDCHQMGLRPLTNEESPQLDTYLKCNIVKTTCYKDSEGNQRYAVPTQGLGVGAQDP